MGLLRTATIAVASTSAAIALLSRRETGSSAAAFNAVSQMVWGTAAVHDDAFSVKRSVVGAACMAGAVTGWSVIATVLAGRRPGAARAVASGVAAGALAYVIDYHVVPARLRPGIELRLSPGAVAATFAALTAGLVIGQLARR